MSDLWPHVTRERPCPICGKTDWCQFGDRAVLCMRVQSTHANANGGWYHFYEQAQLRPPPRKERRQQNHINAVAMMNEFRAGTKAFQLYTLAGSLGVLPESVLALEAAWASKHKAFAFPMRDEHGECVGIRLRNSDGYKWAVTGSRQGIFLPHASVKTQRVAFLPEGPTNTMALLSIGLYAIGRPTCLAGNEIIKATLRRLGIHRVVVVADNDVDKRPDGDEPWYPGIDGAHKLKKFLGLPSQIWNPPLKDVRKFVNDGGTAQEIESDLRNREWTRE